MSRRRGYVQYDGWKNNYGIVVKVRDVIYDEKLLQQVVSQETTIWATHEENDNSVGDLNFFKKVINELLTVDVKIDEEDKALILLSLLSQSYNYIVTTVLYSKKILIL